MKQLVFVHGRAQENKDAVALKAEWVEAFEEGLAKSGLTLPISEADIRFPYYGDTLFQLSKGTSADEAAEIIVRGDDADAEEQAFTRAFLKQVQDKTGITDAQLAEIAGQEVLHRGPLNWEWMQTILKAVDRHVPHGSGTSIALFTHDVYQYLKNPAIRTTIDSGVSAAITPGVETVVVSHSLGTVVAYNLLRAQGHVKGWNIPLFMTLGSPLAVNEIQRTLKPIAKPPCSPRWINAMDERDVVALYPLSPDHFPIDPPGFAIENRTHVRNKTRNRHGIAGYLDDKWVAAQIHAALTARQPEPVEP